MNILLRMAIMAVLLLSAPAWAAPITLSCSLPTENTDGTPLTDLEGVRFYESQTAGGPYDTQIADTPACAWAIDDRPTGTYYFVATAYNTSGIESAYSNEVSKVIPPATPNSPFNLIVVGDLVAYAISQTKDRFVTFPVGSVVAGTACDFSMQANGKYLVPVDAVTFAGTARPVVVFAECSGG